MDSIQQLEQRVARLEYQLAAVLKHLDLDLGGGEATIGGSPGADF